ncbi:MAG: hypothetical protein AAF593_01275 [Planctomycetota bacterium]
MPDTPRAGAYVEATAATIANGEFSEAVEATIREVFAALEAHEKKTGATNGQCKGVVEFNVKRSGSSDEFFDFEFATSVKRPKVSRLSLVRAGGGRALVTLDPDDDADLNGTRQMKLMPTFDRFGNKRAAVDTETGEVVSPDSEAKASGVAGQVGMSGS